MALGSFLYRFSYRLFPGNCLLCGLASNRSLDMCADCEADLPWLHRSPALCRYCAEPLPAGADTCGACIARRPDFDRALCGFQYIFPINRMLSRYKHQGQQVEGKLLHQLMQQFVRQFAGQDTAQTCLLPVSLHPSRLRERGFDQAVSLAGHLARECNLLLETRLLKRVRATASQQHLNRTERRRNLARAFATETTLLRERLASGYKHLVLIDDVLTTGSTCNAAARSLRSAAGKTSLRIDVWCLARTPASPV